MQEGSICEHCNFNHVFKIENHCQDKCSICHLHHHKLLPYHKYCLVCKDIHECDECPINPVFYCEECEEYFNIQHKHCYLCKDLFDTLYQDHAYSHIFHEEFFCGKCMLKEHISCFDCGEYNLTQLCNKCLCLKCGKNHKKSDRCRLIGRVERY